MRVVAKIGMRLDAHLGRKMGDIGRYEKTVIEDEGRRVKRQITRGLRPALPAQQQRKTREREQLGGEINRLFDDRISDTQEYLEEQRPVPLGERQRLQLGNTGMRNVVTPDDVE